MGFQRAQYDLLEQEAKVNVCAVCGGQLQVATDPVLVEYVLRCGHCNVQRPDTRPKNERSALKRIQSGRDYTSIDVMQTMRYLQMRAQQSMSNGKEPEGWVLARLQEMEAMTNGNQALTTYQRGDAAVKEDAAKFVDLARLSQDKGIQAMAVEVVKQTGLNPVLGELVIYRDKLYVTVDGLRHLALKSGLYDGEEAPKFLSREEKLAEGYLEDDVVCRVVIYRKKMRAGIVGTGKANRAKPNGNSQVEAAWPTRTAENRAFRHAWRKGFQDLLSGASADILPDEADEVEESGTMVIDTETGEIIEGTATEVLTQPEPERETQPEPQEQDDEQEEEAAPFQEYGAEEADPEDQPDEERILRVDQQALAEVIHEREFNAEGIHKWISDIRNFGDAFEFLPHARRLEAIERIRTIVRQRGTHGSGAR